MKKPSLQRSRKALIAGLPPGVWVGKVTNGKGKTYFRVALRKRFTGGAMKQRDHSTLTEAREWIFGAAQDERPQVGGLVPLIQRARESVAGMTSAQLEEAAAALKILKPLGIGLADASRFTAKHRAPASKALTLEDVGKQVVEAKRRDHRRPTYINDLRKRWRRFSDYLRKRGVSTLHEVTEAHVRDFVHECRLRPVGRRNMMRNLSAVFGWAVEVGRLKENPCRAIKYRVSKQRTPPRILSEEELIKIFELASAGVTEVPGPDGTSIPAEIKILPGEMIPWLATGCWAGFRPMESERMVWEEVDWTRLHIDFPGDKTKDGAERYVPMQPVLQAWLAPWQGATGSIIPANFRRKKRVLAQAMGWTDWPQDILRHSFGSYHLARYQNSGTTAELMGHSNPKTLFAFYRTAVKSESAKQRYWDMRPPKGESPPAGTHVA